MDFHFGMSGTLISLRQKLRMQRERMQCASSEADCECPLYCLEQLRIFIDITKGEAYNIREDYLWANQMKI